MEIQAGGVVQVGMFPVHPLLSMVHWDGMDSGDTDMEVGIFPVCPFLPMVHCDRMDSGDTGMGDGGWYRLVYLQSISSFIGMG